MKVQFHNLRKFNTTYVVKETFRTLSLDSASFRCPVKLPQLIAKIFLKHLWLTTFPRMYSMGLTAEVHWFSV